MCALFLYILEAKRFRHITIPLPCHKDIKLVLDFVPNHSSNVSDWFVKSLQRIVPYTDYYVWVDPKYDAEGNRIPPNNWVS
jgi:glycosidase